MRHQDLMKRHSNVFHITSKTANINKGSVILYTPKTGIEDNSIIIKCVYKIVRN